jgi:hypothetical protein
MVYSASDTGIHVAYLWFVVLMAEEKLTVQDYNILMELA